MDSSIASTCWHDKLPTYIKRVASHVQLRHCTMSVNGRITIALESDPPAIIWPVFQGHEVSFRTGSPHSASRLFAPPSSNSRLAVLDNLKPKRRFCHELYIVLLDQSYPSPGYDSLRFRSLPNPKRTSRGWPQRTRS